MSGLTHFDENGNARMVDVGDKDDTRRTATARGTIRVSRKVFEAIESGSVAKGDVLTVATIAGITGAKRTADLIPMCHIIPLTGVSITWERNSGADPSYTCICKVSCTGKTGVEMEALTGVSTALLTVYDMCKALDRSMTIDQIFLVEKDGGKSGHYVNTQY